MKRNVLISVSGVLGSGKTVAAKLLAEELGCPLLKERVDENAFLPLFYKEPVRWALATQLFYLLAKIEELKEAKTLLQKTSVVLDSPLEQDVYTYAKAQRVLGNMTEEEFQLYMHYFKTLSHDLPLPDLIINLDVSPPFLEERIQKRARDYEKAVDREYITLLITLQQEWIKAHPELILFTVDADAINLADNDRHKKKFVRMVKEKLTLLKE